MRIVVDTNVVVSGVFFGGPPRRVVEAIASREVNASATLEILDEYSEVVKDMVLRGQGHLRTDALSYFLGAVDVIDSVTSVEACRDHDDDKFIGCAIDAHALYIVSGDKDLLSLGSYDAVEMITASDFCARYLD